MITEQEYEVLRHYRKGRRVKSEDSILVRVLQERGLLTDGFHEEVDESGEIIEVFPTAKRTLYGRKEIFYHLIERNPITRWIYNLTHGF